MLYRKNIVTGATKKTSKAKIVVIITAVVLIVFGYLIAPKGEVNNRSHFLRIARTDSSEEALYDMVDEMKEVASSLSKLYDTIIYSVCVLVILYVVTVLVVMQKQDKENN